MSSARSTSQTKVAVLLIAHGSRREEANLDLARLAEAIRLQARYQIVEIAYLELALPTIHHGGRLCVEQGATQVLMLPYFLSAGRHVVDDLERFRDQLIHEFPDVQFTVCKPLSLHPLMVQIVLARLREAETAKLQEMA